MSWWTEEKTREERKMRGRGSERKTKERCRRRRRKRKRKRMRRIGERSGEEGKGREEKTGNGGKRKGGWRPRRGGEEREISMAPI